MINVPARLMASSNTFLAGALASSTGICQNSRVESGSCPRYVGRMQEISETDPLALFLETVQHIVDVDRLRLESPALVSLKDKGARLIVPLISAGKLVGILSLGPRGSDQEYSTEDRRLLEAMANQTAPTLRVAQMVRQQQADAESRRQLEESMRMQIQEINHRVQEQRIRLSQEIHDGAAQSAYVLSLGLETCIDLVGEDSPVLRRRLIALYQQSREALWHLRQAIDGGPRYEGFSLADVVRDHVASFQTITGIETNLVIDGEPRPQRLEFDQTLFSIAHNALANVFKHAQASHVTVHLKYSGDSVQLDISDDGVGLNVDGESQGPGRGLLNMRKAATELGGQFTLTNSAQGGVLVRVEVPVEEKHADHLAGRRSHDGSRRPEAGP